MIDCENITFMNKSDESYNAGGRRTAFPGRFAEGRRGNIESGERAVPVKAVKAVTTKDTKENLTVKCTCALVHECKKASSG